MKIEMKQRVPQAAMAARRDLSQTEPAATALLVALSQHPQPGPEQLNLLYALAGLQLALGRAFAGAWRERGRAIIELTFKLHALLGQASAKNYIDRQSTRVERP